jgi:pimeloyl-ACP methyl ester carboxylesterase
MELETSLYGESSGSPVVLLHGFPQTAAAWDGVWPALVAAGHRVAVPEQRGYSAAARPAGRSAYRMAELVDDVAGVVADVGGPVHLVGHDWGGAVAWSVAASRPELLRSLTVVSTPHPRALAKAMVTSNQALMSWYIALFQLPVVPERLLLAGGGKQLRTLLRGLDPALVDEYVARMSEPGALTAALNWYRALPFGAPPGHRITTPTLYVWGEKDPALGRAAAEATADHVHGPYEFVPLPGAGHWIPERHADALLPPLLAHLAR